jgi:Polysaccharide deacetylase
LPWAGFGGAISYTFDDANSTQINNESQLLGLGVPFTFYLQGNKPEAKNAFFQRALDAGHELANHTQSHGSGDGTTDVTTMQTFLQTNYGITAYTMAAPNGTTTNYNTVTAQLFLLDRGVNDGVVGADDSPAMNNFPTMLPEANVTAGQFDGKVDNAISKSGWQTVCIHGFQGGSDGAYKAIGLQPFVDHVKSAKTKNIWIGTMENVAAYFIGRKLVKAATPTTEGGSQVYTWNLPTVFPPGKYVRVTIDGGTPSQDGKALTWNDHGFYEVALDAGKLTIAP